jgi:branched-chain amino acid transport system ATP-binding protein
MALLEVKNLNTGYGKKQVLFDVSFDVNKGDIVLLIGSNGSGKSTLLKAIYGLLPVWQNNNENEHFNDSSIYFNGENVTNQQTSDLLKRGLLYIPQKNNLFSDLTVQENLEMTGLSIGSRKILQERIEKVMDYFPKITPHLKRTPMKLSGGERQILTLAMALIHQPKIILLDEPFNGLSLNSIEFVKRKLQQLNKEGISLLIVEHRIHDVLDLCNTVTALRLGCILFTDKLNLLTNKDFKEVFT